MLQATLCLLPAVLLAIPLLARRYPGERRLLAMGCRRRPGWPRPRPSATASRGVVLVAVHGGLLLGRALAVRPPPALSAAS